MFSNIQLGVRDLSRMQRFYDAVLAELGLMRVPEDGAGEAAVIWRRADRRYQMRVNRDFGRSMRRISMAPTAAILKGTSSVLYMLKG